MVLGEVEESVMTREVDEETEEEIVRASGAVLVNAFCLSLTNCCKNSYAIFRLPRGI